MEMDAKARALEDSKWLQWIAEEPEDESLRKSREQLRAGELVWLSQQ